MARVDLAGIVAEQLERARGASSGRSAATVHGGAGSAMRQTVLALLAGRSLAEHESPGEATLQVLAGRVRLTVGAEPGEVGNVGTVGTVGEYAAGALVDIPPRRHGLEALEDAAVLLTVVAGAS